MLQIHGWGRYEYKPGEKPKIEPLTKEEILNLVPGKGKWHYDLRIRPAGKAYWFGFTLTSKLSKVLAGQKSFALLKHYEAPKGSTIELAPPGHHGTLAWMTFEGIIPPQGPENPNGIGNPSRHWAEMYIIDKGKALIKRIENDFVEVEFDGKILNGTYYIRKVKLNKNDPEGGKVGVWLFWKAKKQEKMITEFLDKPILEIEGFASTPTKDRQGDIVLPTAFEESLPRYLKDGKLYLKHFDIALIGYVKEAKILPKGLWIKADIVSPLAAYLITKADYQGLSCGWIPIQKDSLGRLTKVELLEISVTPYPANPDAQIKKIKILDKKAYEEAVKKYDFENILNTLGKLELQR